MTRYAFCNIYHVWCSLEMKGQLKLREMMDVKIICRHSRAVLVVQELNRGLGCRMLWESTRAHLPPGRHGYVLSVYL